MRFIGMHVYKVAAERDYVNVILV